ncbi:MAG: 30S ribosomal protein S9 [Nitrososphaeria archaeon]|nr:30S ribosomal protein S9 [Nitrososphaeria archaeon]NIN52085.1 30S ribosomal protein S9 [Nitrososphaeria archaeon]NIQ32547.1 30S ribosomal protein S9 [Nitrososphaeria archaeon]
MSTSKTTRVFTGSRKTARAQVYISRGKGLVTVNGVSLEILQPEASRLKIIQTLLVGRDVAKKFDIEIRVSGGGFMGQAEAASIAIARALVGVSKSKRLEKLYREFDRTLIAGDSRRTEPKKFGGPGPRRRKQKSYR